MTDTSQRWAFASNVQTSAVTDTVKDGLSQAMSEKKSGIRKEAHDLFDEKRDRQYEPGAFANFNSAVTDTGKDAVTDRVKDGLS